jgi:aspartate aminotransferase-like enzyme
MKLVRKSRMFTPGPTPLLPEAILPALVQPLNHRKDDFKTLFREVQEGLRQVYKTQNEVLVLTCSGSGAMEAAMTNVSAPGDKAVVCVAGKFGERWMELAAKFGVQSKIIQVPYGESIDPAEIERALAADPDITAVFIQAMETSTGAMMDMETVGKMLKTRSNTILVVDAITALGTMVLETDAWGLDVVIGGSQKAFMLPPGGALVSVSDKAWKRIENCGRPRYYFDLLKERKAQRDGQTAFTPAIALIQGLKPALRLMLESGIENFIANAALQAGAMRAAVAQWGMRIFPRIPGDAVTAFCPPAGVETARVISLMRDRFGVLLGGGQGSMKGKIIRVGHVGYFDFLETLGMIGCLELSLAEAGAMLEPGSGSRAALEYYRKVEGRI